MCIRDRYQRRVHGAEKEGKIPNKKLMAILCPAKIQKQFVSKPLALDLLSVPQAQGRGVYLTETDLAHNSALKEGSEFSMVFAQVLLGEGGALNIHKSNTRYKAGFKRFNHFQFSSDGKAVYVVYNLAQVYPLYQIKYKVPANP
eukprot:TRINITY_DN5174_c0_g1_i4.p1 TRINITY_DN5174_c0_g1~~TRINITY_DN5174_c0_g1_i4.p1  ORF type:complete len:144 (-),score=24.46 TRINITY_DN5174_c0_g1_i4:34-465(-)